MIWGRSCHPSPSPEPASFHLPNMALLCAAPSNGAFLLGHGDLLQEKSVWVQFLATRGADCSDSGPTL